MNHFRFSVRRLVRSRLFTVAVVSLLAIGIGVTTSVFSLVDAVLFRPLSVQHPEELIEIAQNAPQSHTLNKFPYVFYTALYERSTTFASVAGQLEERVVLSEPGPAEEVRVNLTTPQFFTMLGESALYGRTLLASDETYAIDTPPALLSYEFWQRRFGSDPRAIGRAIKVGGNPFVVVGVMPRSFNGISADTTSDISIPFRYLGLLAVDSNKVSHPFVNIVARLKPGSTRSEAQAECLVIWRNAIQEYWDGLDRSSPWTRERLAEDLMMGVQVEPIERGISVFRDRYRPALVIITASVCILQLMLCANVAALMLVRNARRSEEMAVRVSLGASRKQVFSLILTESVILTLIGATGGLGVAYITIPLLIRELPPIRDLLNNRLIVSLDVGLDFRVFIFSLFVSALSVMLFSLIPGIASSRVNLNTLLRGGNSTSPWKWHRNLLIAQIAICTLLSYGSILMLHTMQSLHSIDPGFDSDHVISFTVDPKLCGYTSEQVRNLRRSVTDQVARLPEVASVASSRFPIMRGSGVKLSVAPAGTQLLDSEPPNVSFNNVSPSYFETMGTRIIAGRTLSETQDAPHGQGEPTKSVVNQAFAALFFPNVNPLGRRFGPAGNQEAYVVVGVVNNAKLRSLREPIQPTFYIGESTDDRVVFYVRVHGHPSFEVRPALRIFAALDPSLPVTEIHTLAEEMRSSIAGDRFETILASTFAVLAMILVIIGIYGLLSLIVVQRRREIAIRIACGAHPSAIISLMVGQFGQAIAIGVVVGIGAVLMVGPSIRSLLYGVAPDDVGSLAVVLGLIATLAIGGAALPIFWALRVQPAFILRQDN